MKKHRLRENMIWQAALFQQKDWEEFGFALLVLRLVSDEAPQPWNALTGSADVRMIWDFGTADSGSRLCGNIQSELEGRSEDVAACCIIVDSNDPRSIEAARACAIHLDAFGIKKIVGSFFIGDAAIPDQIPNQPFITLHFARTHEGIFHAARQLLIIQPQIGIDWADLFDIWTNRRGIIHRVRATLADAGAFRDGNEVQMNTAAAVLVSCWHHGAEGPRLSDVDEIATLIFRNPLNTSYACFVSLNAALNPVDIEWVEIAVFTG